MRKNIEMIQAWKTLEDIIEDLYVKKHDPAFREVCMYLLDNVIPEEVNFLEEGEEE